MISYKVKDLYIGTLGYVTISLDIRPKITKKNIFIIYRKEELRLCEYCAIEILTNKKYYIFSNDYLDYKINYRMINDFAIFSSLPLSSIVKQEKVTKKELVALQEKLNDLSKKGISNLETIEDKNEIEEYKKMEQPITDSILLMILETSKKVKESSIDDNLKEIVLKQLEELGDYYVNEVINKITKIEDKLTLETENEYTIKMNVMKKLVEIEEFYQNPNNEKVYSLKKQLSQFRKNVK